MRKLAPSWIGQSLLFVLAMLLGSKLSAQSPTQKMYSSSDLHEYLLGQLDRLEFKKLDSAAQIAIYLSVSKALHQGGLEELSKAIEADALDVAKRDKGGIHDRAVFDHALETRQFEMAEEIANRPTSKFMKKHLTAARIRAGDVGAFKKGSYAVTDFHTADTITRALVDSGEHAKAIDFATGLVFKADDGNDPKSILGFVYTQIALKEFKAGETDLAKQHIDKAKQIAGGMFYTGYCIEVDHKTIHENLGKDIDGFARRGAAYRGHMGDELVANYARALRENGFYKETRQAIKHITKPDNLDHAKTYLAIEQIKKRKFELGAESIKMIESQEMKFLAQMHLAIQLRLDAKISKSETLIGELERKWLDGKVFKCDRRFWYLLGATGDLARTKRHLERTKSEQEKSKMILAVLQGLAGTPIY